PRSRWCRPARDDPYGKWGESEGDDPVPGRRDATQCPPHLPNGGEIRHQRRHRTNAEDHLAAGLRHDDRARDPRARTRCERYGCEGEEPGAQQAAAVHGRGEPPTRIPRAEEDRADPPREPERHTEHERKRAPGEPFRPRPRPRILAEVSRYLVRDPSDEGDADRGSEERGV